jgi:uncharacterized membrane-anchored protein
LGDDHCLHHLRHDHADFADRSLGVGYTGGSSILLFCLLATLGLWYWLLGSISVDTVGTPREEVFYWAAITFSQTLGTALGDWMADSTGLGYEGGALVFGAALAVVAAAYFWTDISRVTLFSAAFILTRPLGATVGDFLDKPRDHGGLALSGRLRRRFSQPLYSDVFSFSRNEPARIRSSPG